MYPEFANVMKEKMKTRGKYAKGFPVGATIHFTAGHDGAENTILDGIKSGFAYWCINRRGTLFCAHPADEYGYHCGESKWTKFAKKLVDGANDGLIGIEMNAYGLLTLKEGRLFTWFGKEVSITEARYCDGSSPDQMKGWYHMYTPKQEETLIQTLLWLKAQRPDVFDFDYVLGHSEISGKLGLGYWRKSDPSAALSMPMPEFRELLKKRYTEKKA